MVQQVEIHVFAVPCESKYAARFLAKDVNMRRIDLTRPIE